MYRLSQAHTYRLLHRARRGSASRTRPPNQPPRRSHVAPESRAGPLHPTPIHTFIHLPTYSVHIQVYGPMNPVVALGASRSVLAMWGVNHGGYVIWALLLGNIRSSVLAVLLPILVACSVCLPSGVNKTQNLWDWSSPPDHNSRIESARGLPLARVRAPIGVKSKASVMLPTYSVYGARYEHYGRDRASTRAAVGQHLRHTCARDASAVTRAEFDTVVTKLELLCKLLHIKRFRVLALNHARRTTWYSFQTASRAFTSRRPPAPRPRQRRRGERGTGYDGRLPLRF